MWDYVVIGAGSAGCAITYELIAAGKGLRVLLVKSGDNDRSPWIKLPMWQPQASAKFDWGYRSEPDPTRGGQSENWKRGRVLGGCSSTNGMVYVRGAAEDFDRWSTYCGNYGGWSSPEIMELFRDLEASDQHDHRRGRHGRVKTTTVRKPHPVTRAFMDSAVRSGHVLNPDYNAGSQEGVSLLQRTLRRGFRWSAAKAFLAPIKSDPNLTIATNADVERIVFEDRHAVGVEMVREGKRVIEHARNIILSAGAINSPKILMLSGVGDEKDLAPLGIETTHHLPGVGKNLREHPLIRMVFRSKVPTYNLTEGLLQRLRIATKFALHGEGPISVVYESTLVFRTQVHRGQPDVQLYFAPLGYLGKMGGTGKLAEYPAFMICFTKSHPESTGWISLANGDAKAPPKIHCRLLSSEADVLTLVHAIQDVRKIAANGPLADMIEEEILPGGKVANLEALSSYVRENTEPAFHPIGTCRMGIDAQAVVAPDLSVHGVENLWIADASIMPDHISANINAACMMIGMKLGRQLASCT